MEPKKVRDKDKHTDTKDEAQKELMDKMCLQSKYHTLKMQFSKNKYQK